MRNAASAVSKSKTLWAVGSSVHGLLQARVLEWAAVSYPRGSPQPGIEPASFMSLAWQVGSLALAPPGKPLGVLMTKYNGRS